jgi:FeS assembly SUF system protein
MENERVAPVQGGGVDREALRQRIVEVMQTVYDPEIPVNIYELGMVYDIQIDEEANATVTMTLTSPACPVAGSLPGEVEFRVGTIEGLKSARVNLVWEPPWTPERMSEAAKLQLGMM